MKPVRRWVVLCLDEGTAVVSVHNNRVQAIEDAEARAANSGIPHAAIVQIVSAAVVITEFDQLRFKWLNRYGRSR